MSSQKIKCRLKLLAHIIPVPIKWEVSTGIGQSPGHVVEDPGIVQGVPRDSIEVKFLLKKPSSVLPEVVSIPEQEDPIVFAGDAT